MVVTKLDITNFMGVTQKIQKTNGKLNEQCYTKEKNILKFVISKMKKAITRLKGIFIIDLQILDEQPTTK